MSPEETALAVVLEILTQLEIPYMLTGSIAASFYGRPRTTHDADIVIDPNATQMDDLVHSLAAAGFYAEIESARSALRARRPFSVIETAHACKVDLIVRRARPFSEEEFARRRAVDLPFARAVSMVTAEDSILSKLEWARQSGDSERQLADAVAIVSVTRALDAAYIDQWSGVLGVTDLWHRVRNAGR